MNILMELLSPLGFICWFRVWNNAISKFADLKLIVLVSFVCHQLIALENVNLTTKACAHGLSTFHCYKLGAWRAVKIFNI